MVIAAVGAIAVGHAEDAAALLFLFSLSNWLETMAMAKTKSAIEGLIQLRPKTALLLSGGEDVEVPIQDLEVGDKVRVLSFQQIPIDGIVEEGGGEVDEHAMSGESVPVAKSQGSSVFAGTQNLDGTLVIRVSARSTETALERIVKLVEEAQENKASGERISLWFGERYTYFVLLAAGLSLVARLVIGSSMGDAFYASLILLVALSPCALVISTPASTLSALAYAARRGILVRGGEFIETAGQIDVIALDKTGTLTEGKPRLVEVCSCSRELVMAGHEHQCSDSDACWHGGDEMSPDARRMLSFAAAAEQYSTHPIAAAIVEAARSFDIDIPEATSSQAVAGLGVRAKIDGRDIRIGQRFFFEREGERLPQAFVHHFERMQAKGMTVAIMEHGNEFAAFGLRDEPRRAAPSIINQLEAQNGLEVVMLTGDTEQTAAAVATELGIANYHSGLMPQDKAALIEQWTSAGKRVMMVGDGINDAPSLAKANVGIAMGGLGSDIAMQAADVVLVQDRIERIPEFMDLGRRTNRIIKANLVFAAGVIVALAFGSLFFKLPLPLAVVGHEGSTVLVILNGLRLLSGRSAQRA
ncbi:MAG: Zinc-transporting ATPase [Fimbriimonadaceae bacterium]|nr:Zinc-transporting ATPase [Fimbriimonadaceae bacterium]